MAKDAWGVIGSAYVYALTISVAFTDLLLCSLSVQQVMQDMDRLLAKGEVPEEEMRALEMDVTGKIMLASWRGTRFEVVQVLREVSSMHRF